MRVPARRYFPLLLAALLNAVPDALGCSQVIVPFPYNLKRSRLVVTGNVVEVRGEPGRQFAVFEIVETLKGKPPGARLELAFREKVDQLCSERVEYRVGAAHLLLFSGSSAAADLYPQRFDATPGRTADNVRSALRILESDDLDEKRALYRSVFESGDRVFLKDALEGLKRLRGDDAPIVERILLAALASGARREDYWMFAEIVRLRSLRAAPVLETIASGSSESEIRQAAIDALGQLEARSASRTLKDLAERDIDAAARKRAIASLARIGGAESAEFLRTLHRSEDDPELRGFILEQLAVSGSPAAAGLAMACLDSAAPGERQGAYRALGRLRFREAFPELVRRLVGAAPFRDAPWIAAALVEIDGAAAAPHLIPMLEGPAARSMPELLGRTGSEAARRALLDYMKRDLARNDGMRTPVLLEPILALGGDEANRAILDLTGHPNGYLRSKAIQALGKFRIAAAFAPLAGRLSDPANGGDAAGALLQIDYERGLSEVVGWLDKDPRRVISDQVLWAAVQRRDRRILDLIENRIRLMPDGERRDRLTRAAEAIRAGS